MLLYCYYIILYLTVQCWRGQGIQRSSAQTDRWVVAATNATAAHPRRYLLKAYRITKLQNKTQIMVAVAMVAHSFSMQMPLWLAAACSQNSLLARQRSARVNGQNALALVHMHKCALGLAKPQCCWACTIFLRCAPCSSIGSCNCIFSSRQAGVQGRVRTLHKVNKQIRT